MWQSLYDYLTIPTCAEFLDRIQGDDNERHLDWRYCLIQEHLPPPNSADAMLAIWASLMPPIFAKNAAASRAVQ